MKSDPRTAQIPSPTFSAFLPSIREDLIEAEIFTPRNHLIARTIIDFLDRSQKVEINEKKYHEGWTRPVAHSEISGQSGYCVRSVIRAIEDMIDAEMLEKRKTKYSDVCFSYRFKAYDRLHQHLEENPTSDIVSTTQAYQVQSDIESKGYDTESDNQEFLEKEEPPTSLGNSTGTAQSTPTAKEEGGFEEISQKAEPDVPASAPGPGIEEKKNSQKEKGDLSLSPNLLAQEFHDLFGPEEPTERLLDVSSSDFFRRADDGSHTGILMDLMRDTKLLERFPDSTARAHACITVVRRAMKILHKTLDSEWGEIKSPRFLNTPTGQRAISKARTEICRPSLEIDSDSQPASTVLTETVESLLPNTERSSDPLPVEPEPTLKNPNPKAWQRDNANASLHPDMQAILDRIQSGTPPPDMDDEPLFKKARQLRKAE